MEEPNKTVANRGIDGRIKLKVKEMDNETDAKTVTQQRDSNGKFVKGNTCGFQPGEISNPLGPPKKEDSLVMCLKEELEALSENGITTNARMIAQMLVYKAKVGSLKATEMALDYVSGKPNQSVSLSGKLDHDVTFLIGKGYDPS